MKTPVILNWSGGKDAALALHTLYTQPEFVQQYTVVGLLTTMQHATDCSYIHDIPLPLLRVQAQHLGLPLHVMYLPETDGFQHYNRIMRDTVLRFIETGIRHFAFGDIQLAPNPNYRLDSIKSYREEQYHPLGATVLAPLWGATSQEIMVRFLESGLQSLITTVDSRWLDPSFLGKRIDRDLLETLPNSVDCCGENGEYHSFCFDGPIFNSRVPFQQHGIDSHQYTFKGENGEDIECQYWQLMLRSV